jgi:hypothetical protein
MRLELLAQARKNFDAAGTMLVARKSPPPPNRACPKCHGAQTQAWLEQRRDEMLPADAILDRLIHNAHRIDLTGDSLRRRRPAARAVE